ncbi:MAG TPA: cell division protein FtsQ/DivIB [Bacillales bacterium]|nr:cell division protein FtsQ/DivIB [Bacillales bacterium]
MRNKEKVITLEDRVPKLKEQRRQKANRRLILYISIFFFLILVIGYFLSPISHVQSISVSGNHFVSKAAILKTSGLSQKTSFWDVHPAATEKKIQSLKEIKSATVKKHFPNAVTINVTENSRVAYLKRDGNYFPILENGAQLPAINHSDVPADAPILVNWPDGKHLDNMAKQLKKLPGAIVHSISEIYYTPEKNFPGMVTLYMNDGFEVRALIDDFARKMAEYPKIVSQLQPGVKGIIHLGTATYFEKYGTGGKQADEKKK